jgi:hypothetical protein
MPKIQKHFLINNDLFSLFNDSKFHFYFEKSFAKTMFGLSK